MEELGFEQALARLEEIVEKLEEGNLLLEEALKVFEEGVGLVRICSRRLEEGEKRISLLLRSEEGQLIERPFEELGEREEEG
jgi:exodeoxyribonuclease VII small subunit